MRVLVVYSGFTRRPTLLHGLLAYENYSAAQITYYNTRYPRYLQGIKKGENFDIIIFSTLFFSRRTDHEKLIADINSVKWLKTNPAIKVATPQDEYINSKYVNDFIDEFGIKIVFSVQPECVIDQVYPQAKNRGFEVKKILTGYIDDELVERFSNENKWKRQKRTIDIGYRTTGIPPAWYGRHAMLKSVIADEFQAACDATNLVIDIDPRSNASISNETWYDFLGKCRYTIGTEGGTSILDFDGSIKEKTENYVREHPNAKYHEIEKNCFPGIDGKFQGYALSPRHLEACLTRTAQVLVRGDYSGVLKPWVHYIPLEKDFSNLKEVIDLLEDEDLRLSLVNRCYEDIVLSDVCRSSYLVNYVLNSTVLLVDRSYLIDMNKNLFLRFVKFINRPGGVLFQIIDIIRYFRKIILLKRYKIV